MTVVTTADRRTIAHIRKAEKPVRGSQRSGIQASDLLAAMTDPMQYLKQAPRVEKPRVLIETIRFIENDAMNAKDSALYEMLLAYARKHGIEKPEHQITIADMAKYLETKNLDRLVESLERISAVRVRYDFVDEEIRRRGTQPLILAEVREQMKAGVAHLTYSIPPAIRRVILASRDYAMLEINAFSKFKCRYSSRLYQRLALRAGMDAEVRKPWTIEPEKLAEELGYPTENFSFGIFKRDCLLPALADMSPLNVTRFRVTMDAPRGGGRGRGVSQITFRMTDATKRAEETKAAHLSRRGMDAIRMTDESLSHDELPSTLVVARMVTKTGLDELTLNNGWRSAYERAKAAPNAEVMPGLVGGLLINVVQRNGVGEGFSMWAEMAAAAAEIPTHRLRTAPVAIAPTAAAAPEVPNGGMSAGLLAMLKERPTEEGRLARAKELAQSGALDIIDALRGFYPGTQFKASFDDGHFAVYCDSQVCPWDSLQKHVNGFGSLVAALRILRWTDDEQRRKSLRNLAYAIKKWDMVRVLRIAGAIIASNKAGTMPAPPPAPSRPRTARGFTPTRQVSEASAEYDFTDPAYAAGAMPWDDRDAADLDPDQCPF